MKISVSGNYWHTQWSHDGLIDTECGIEDCERHYCNDHRKLWRDCDTAIKDQEGSGRKVWELNGCPECERKSQRKHDDQLVKEWEQHQIGKCAVHGSWMPCAELPNCREYKREEQNARIA